MVAWSLLVIVHALPCRAHGAGIDCSKVDSAADKTVCAEPALLAMDAELAREYDRAKQALSEPGRRMLSRDQKQWIRFAGEACNDPGGRGRTARCLKSLYDARINDMKSTGLRVGPFVFGRRMYLHVGADEGSASPYRVRLSYAVIDTPLSEVARRWNAAVTPTRLAETATECDGGRGDVEMHDRVLSATAKAISIERSRGVYCRGAAHPLGSDRGVTYVLAPDFHRLTARDLFLPGAAWASVLNEKCYEALRSRVGSDRVIVDREQVRRVATDPSRWTIAAGGLAVAYDAGGVLPYVYGAVKVAVPWSDLRPLLAPSAPIPQ